MGMERVGRAGPVVLLFVPFRDGGDVLGYPLGEFAVENFDRGRWLEGFRESWEAGMDRGRRGGSAVLLSNRIGGARTEGNLAKMQQRCR